MHPAAAVGWCPTGDNAHRCGSPPLGRLEAPGPPIRRERAGIPGLCPLHEGKLPGHVDHVLDAGVHALRAGRAVDVRAVATQQQAADPQPLHHAAVDPEPGVPGHVVKACEDVRALVVDPLQLVQRRFRVLRWRAKRVAGDQSKATAPHREQPHEAVRRREDVHVGRRRCAGRQAHTARLGSCPRTAGPASCGPRCAPSALTSHGVADLSPPLWSVGGLG